MNFFNYQGPIDPSPLQPKIGLSYLEYEPLMPIVNDLNRWQFKNAMNQIEDIIDNTSTDAPLRSLALRLRGEVLVHFNEFEKAFKIFQEVLSENPRDIQALVLCTALAWQLKFDYTEYLLQLRERDLVYYTRLQGILNFVEENMEKFDLEIGIPDSIEFDTLALFGHRFEDDGSFSQALLKRLAKTLQMAQQFPQSQIIVSGGAALSPFLEADRMETWLIEHGIPQERIYKDSLARDTVGNTIGIVDIMNHLKSQYCLAITSLSHLPRAWMALYLRAQTVGNTAKIYGAAPESPNSISLPDDERLYMLFTSLKSANLVEYKYYRPSY